MNIKQLNLSPTELDLTIRIALRYLDALGVVATRTEEARNDVMADIILARKSGCKISLRRLMNLSDLNFVHDLRAIRSGQLDFLTGRLADGTFLFSLRPRRMKGSVT